jgi:membrane protein
MGSATSAPRGDQGSKPRASAKNLGALLKETFVQWYEDDCLQWGAALAYYLILALAPLVISVLTIAGLVFSPAAVAGELAGQIEHYVGQDGARVIQDILARAHQPTAGALATAFALIMLFWGASSAFSQLRKTLNHIWNVPTAPSESWGSLAASQLLAAGMVLVVGAVLIFSLLLSSVVTAVSTYAAAYLPASTAVSYLLELLASWLVVSLLFAVIFKWLPNVRLRWSDVLLGAGVTGFLFIVGKFLIGLYLGYAAIGSAYGAASSLIVLLVWIYYSAQVFFLGAEFTQVWARRRPRLDPRGAGA